MSTDERTGRAPVMNHGPLGQQSAFPVHYDPAVLYPIPRLSGRCELGLTERLPFGGQDIWNAYEMSWLDADGKPRVAVAELRVPAESPCIVESKSLKLYFGSFNHARFDSLETVQQRMREDISHTVGAPVSLALASLSQARAFDVCEPEGECLDDEVLLEQTVAVNAAILRCRDGESSVHERLRSDLLRSNCPVTGQPDWASVYIEYRGRAIDRASLLTYIVSFRDHNDFHEQCVERMFCDIKQRCAPECLTVYARYTRRGGIDINPFRSDFQSAPLNRRLIRQ